MSQLKRLLHKNPITLILDLWENDVDLAALAEEAGIDAIMLSSLEKADNILSEVEIPVGLNVKESVKNKDLSKFDFVNFELPNIDKVEGTNIVKVAEIKADFSVDQLMNLEDQIEAIDAAIIPDKGIKNLFVGDLQNYISLIIASKLPVIIPTQRAIKPSEVSILWDAGAKGIILNRNAFGNSLRNFEKIIREFRIAADDLGG